MVEEAAELLKPARDELIRQAAQGEVVLNDDTSMRVLRLTREPSDERTVTSGIVSTSQGWKIALYFTGRQHAGENLAGAHASGAGKRFIPNSSPLEQPPSPTAIVVAMTSGNQPLTESQTLKSTIVGLPFRGAC